MKKVITFIFLTLPFCWYAIGAETQPGEFYRSQHAKWVAEFDLNEDGWLNAQEREKMRATPKTEGNQFRRGKEKRGRKAVRFDMPQHWADKYDKDGDGGLSDEESRKGFFAERARLFKVYDVNENKNLDLDETEKLAEDIESGKYESWDRYVATTTLRDAEGETGPNRPRLNARQKRWLEWDEDGDGRASTSEIMAIRNAEKE